MSKESEFKAGQMLQKSVMKGRGCRKTPTDLDWVHCPGKSSRHFTLRQKLHPIGKDDERGGSLSQSVSGREDKNSCTYIN
jgi:hypothetical protein